MQTAELRRNALSDVSCVASAHRYAYVQLFTYNRRGITAAETAHH